MDPEELPLDNSHEIDFTALGKETTEKLLDFWIVGKVDKVVNIHA
jgi:hypothetical protein